MISSTKNPLLRFFSIDTESGNRNYGLDVMRAIGLLIVLCGHSLHFFEPYFPKIFRLSHFFHNGVELFFALSGFLIGGILIRGVVEKKNIAGTYLWTFLKRRWYKTLPGYFLALVVIYLAGYFITGYHKDFNVSYIFFLQNLHESESWFFPLSYSLTIEEWFYIIFPILFFTIIFLFRKIISFKKMLIITALIFIVGSLVYRLWVYFNLHPHWDTVMRKSILTRLDCTVYGVLLAAWFYSAKNKMLSNANWLLLCGLALHALSLFFRIKYPEGYFYYVLYFTTIPVSFVMMIPWFYKLKTGNRFLFKLFTALSLISYSFYLIHLSPIQEIMMHYIHTTSLLVTSAWYFIYLLVVFLLALIWYKYYEKPVMYLRER